MAKTYTTPHTPRESSIIARADRFSVFCFGGRESREKTYATTIEAARIAAKAKAAERRKPVLIYACAGDDAAYLETVAP